MAHPTRIFGGGCHRGRASTRPYIACCTSTKYARITSTKNTPRVTSRSCRSDWEVARPSAWRTHPHSGVAVTAGELPLAPTLHIVNQQNTQGLYQQYTPGLHRVAVGATRRSPAHPHGAPTHIPGLVSPRASFHSPLHCMLYINEIHRDYINKTYHGLHRVAVGATGRSPATSAWRAHPHPGVAVTTGELPLAPTLHVVHQ